MFIYNMITFNQFIKVFFQTFIKVFNLLYPTFMHDLSKL